MRTLQLLLCIAAAATLFACDRNVTYTEETSEPASCFNCHSDDDTALIAAHDQWEHSLHGSSLNTNRSTTPCNQCHTSEGFKEYLDSGTLPANVENPTAIHCFTCHAPHTNGDFSLRIETAQTLKNGVMYDLGAANICASCHQGRENVETYVEGGIVNITNSRWGPHHSVQADMLIGTNGYEYAGYNYSQTNHRGVTDDGCVDCHMKYTRNSKVGGHTWNMRWTDEEGEILNTAACYTDCHAAPSPATFDYNGVQTEITMLADSLHTLLVARGYILANGNRVSGTRTSDEAGAIWNWLMIEEDRSWGVHNANYMRDLLQSSIDFLNTPVPAPAGPVAARKEGGHAGSR